MGEVPPPDSRDLAAQSTTDSDDSGTGSPALEPDRGPTQTTAEGSSLGGAASDHPDATITTETIRLMTDGPTERSPLSLPSLIPRSLLPPTQLLPLSRRMSLLLLRTSSLADENLLWIRP